jgi:hypothetical protein
MSSLKQIDANRRNALKSTGPTTREGKQRSRCNAVRHGLTAETVIAALEDSEDYEAFEAAVISDYDAESAVERELVLRLASVLWRLRRATGIETALFESATEDSRKHERRLSCENLGRAADLTERNRRLLQRFRNPTLRRKTRSAPVRTRISLTASCAWHTLWRQARQFVYDRVVAAPQATLEQFNLSLFVPATRVRRLVRRVQVTLAGSLAERANHCCGSARHPN